MMNKIQPGFQYASSLAGGKCVDTGSLFTFWLRIATFWRVIVFISHKFCRLYRFLCVSALVCIICVWFRKVIKISGWLVLFKTNEDFCPSALSTLWEFFLCCQFPWGWHTDSWQGIQKKVLSLGLLPRRAQKSYQVWKHHLPMAQEFSAKHFLFPTHPTLLLLWQRPLDFKN